MKKNNFMVNSHDTNQELPSVNPSLLNIKNTPILSKRPISSCK